jgi:hypothetical protein
MQRSGGALGVRDLGGLVDEVVGCRLLDLQQVDAQLSAWTE